MEFVSYDAFTDREPFAHTMAKVIPMAVTDGAAPCKFLILRTTNLGWMTRAAGVKTTLATKRAFRGPRSQAGASFFSGLTLVPTISLFDLGSSRLSQG